LFLVYYNDAQLKCQCTMNLILYVTRSSATAKKPRKNIVTHVS